MKLALKQCKRTAPGPDGIHYEMLQHLHSNASTFLLYIFNFIWLNGVFPKSWRNAHLIMFLKPNKDPLKPSSYRPIALTSCICKLMEKMVNIRLTHELEKRDILKAGIHLRAESEINVESWGLSSVHTPESALGES
jgi:potassium voltage-gated channel Eag-related subfamily H protein 8